MNLLDTISLPTLNGKYEAKVKSYRQVTNTQGGYVEIILQLPDREHKYLLFPGKGDAKGKQINYFMSCIRKQLQLEGTQTLASILDAAKETAINVWFGYDEFYGRQTIEFHEVTESTNTNSLLDIEGA